MGFLFFIMNFKIILFFSFFLTLLAEASNNSSRPSIKAESEKAEPDVPITATEFLMQIGALRTVHGRSRSVVRRDKPAIEPDLLGRNSDESRQSAMDKNVFESCYLPQITLRATSSTRSRSSDLNGVHGLAVDRSIASSDPTRSIAAPSGVRRMDPSRVARDIDDNASDSRAVFLESFLTKKRSSNAISASARPEKRILRGSYSDCYDADNEDDEDIRETDKQNKRKSSQRFLTKKRHHVSDSANPVSELSALEAPPSFGLSEAAPSSLARRSSLARPFPLVVAEISDLSEVLLHSD